MPYQKTVETAWRTSETGGTTAATAHVNSSRTAAVAETRTTSAPGRSVKDSVIGMVGFWTFSVIKPVKSDRSD